MIKYWREILILILLVTVVFAINTCDKQNVDFKTGNVQRQIDSIHTLYRGLQVNYDKKEKRVSVLEGELLESKAAVKRSDDALDKAKVNEKVYLRRIKEQTRLMSDARADSALRYRYRQNPDSIPQRVLYELARLDECDSVRSEQARTIASLNNYAVKADSALSVLDSMNKLSRDQISLLLLSQSKDIELISIKNKELRRQKRLKVLGFIAAPILVLVTVLLLN